MKFKLDYDLVDAITLKALKSHRKILKKQLKNHLENGAWMHQDDVVNTPKLINALDVIIDYYGG
jgi:hypothetical protein